MESSESPNIFFILKNFIDENKNYIDKVECRINEKMEEFSGNIKELEQKIEKFKEHCLENRLIFEKEIYNMDKKHHENLHNIELSVEENKTESKTEIKWVSFIITAIISSLVSFVSMVIFNLLLKK